MGAIVAFVIICIVILGGMRRAKKKAIKDNMSKIDFSKEKEYYRDILKEYGPEELSYIDNYQIKYPKEIIAILLNLKLKRKIEINEDKIIILDSNQEGLKKAEKFILQSVKAGKVIIEKSSHIEAFAKEQALEDGLVKKNTEAEQKIRKKTVKTVISVIVVFILYAIFYSITADLNPPDKDIMRIIIPLTTCFFGCAFIYFFSVVPSIIFAYSEVQKNIYIRTEKGEEINKKIEGLKKYMIDYSLINEKGNDELIIWEEYLIYSVIFDLNKNILEEMSKLIET